jgi:hypothetical protein
MEEIWKWVIENKSWIFDGIGVAIITGLIAIFLRRRQKDEGTKQTQVSGDNSVNIQSAGNVTINKEGKTSNGKRTKSNKR